MTGKSILLSGIAASFFLVPANRAAADAGDFVAGAIVGAIVNHAARNQPRKKVYRRTQVKRKAYRPGIPSTQSGREIQSSLNYFGFNAGTVDGQLGRKTRDAVSQYQAYLGYPITGQLSTFEQELLVSSYNRAQAGGYATQQQIAVTPDGTRGLLKVYRTEMAGGGAVQAPQTTVVVAPAAPVVVAPMPPADSLTVSAPAAEATDGALPNLFGNASTKVSLASHCNSVNLKTSANGGYMTVAAMNDPAQVLDEQFCLARTYAIADGEQLAQGLGAAPDQIAAHCATYGERMKPYVGALSFKRQDAVIAEVAEFVADTGIAPQDLAATAKVCLSVGYKTDDMDEALGAALILVSLGNGAYGELLGHHLYEGIGANKRADLAWDWFDTGLNGAAQQAVFAPSQPERIDLLRSATFTLRSGNRSGALPVVTPQKASALPSFSVSK